MKFKTLFLFLILASSLLLSFNSYAYSVVEDGCNPDEDVFCEDDCDSNNSYGDKSMDRAKINGSRYPKTSWCSDRHNKEFRRANIEQTKKHQEIYCDNMTFKKSLKLKDQWRVFIEWFAGSCTQRRSWSQSEFFNKVVEWLTEAAEYGDSRAAMGELWQFYSGPHMLHDVIERNGTGYFDKSLLDKEKSDYWKSRLKALEEGKKGTIKAAKNKPNGKPKNKPKAGGVGTGTGFVVTKDGVIATAEHVVNGCNKIEVDNLEASIVVADDKNDIALIKVNKTYKDIASIKVRSPKLGDDVMVFGYPLSNILSAKHVSLTKGSVSSLSGMRDDTTRFRYTAASQPGNSGGPIVDDKGMVVGIVSAGLKNDKSLDVNWQNVNFGVRSSLLVNLMDSKNVPITTQERSKEESKEHYEKVTKYIKCFK